MSTNIFRPTHKRTWLHTHINTCYIVAVVQGGWRKMQQSKTLYFVHFSLNQRYVKMVAKLHRIVESMWIHSNYGMATFKVNYGLQTAKKAITRCTQLLAGVLRHHRRTFFSKLWYCSKIGFWDAFHQSGFLHVQFEQFKQPVRLILHCFCLNRFAGNFHNCEPIDIIKRPKSAELLVLRIFEVPIERMTFRESRPNICFWPMIRTVGYQKKPNSTIFFASFLCWIWIEWLSRTVP